MVETKNEECSQEDLQDMLKIYYKRLFPRQVFYRWLTYGHSKFKQTDSFKVQNLYRSFGYSKEQTRGKLLNQKISFPVCFFVRSSSRTISFPES